MKYFLFFLFLTISAFTHAQKIESIHVNLYTDSLKKGTYNYINIDGKLSNGKYLPLDSSDIIFSASDGRFSGNNLWIDPDFKKDKVTIKAILRSDHSLFKEFTIYIKKIPNPTNLKTMDDLMGETDRSKKSRKSKS
ncbi:MAG: hypothetical protein ABI594_00820 [Ginsengibacter sp.]